MMGPKPEGSCEGIECLTPATVTDEDGRRFCEACAKHYAEKRRRRDYCPSWLIRDKPGTYDYSCSLTPHAMQLLRAVTTNDPKRSPYVVSEFEGWRAALAKELGLVVPEDET